jgi:hypothetical protein
MSDQKKRDEAAQRQRDEAAAAQRPRDPDVPAITPAREPLVEPKTVEEAKRLVEQRQQELRDTARAAREKADAEDATRLAGLPEDAAKLPDVGEEIWYMRNNSQTPARCVGVWEHVKGAMISLHVEGEGTYRNVTHSEEPKNGRWGYRGEGGEVVGTPQWGGEVSVEPKAKRARGS